MAVKGKMWFVGPSAAQWNGKSALYFTKLHVVFSRLQHQTVEKCALASWRTTGESPERHSTAARLLIDCFVFKFQNRGWDRLLKYNFWVLKKMSKKSRKQKFSPCFSSSFCYSSPSSFPILSGRSELKSYPFFFKQKFKWNGIYIKTDFRHLPPNFQMAVDHIVLYVYAYNFRVLMNFVTHQFVLQILMNLLSLKIRT